MTTPSGMAHHGQAPPITVPTHSLTRYLRATVEVSGGVVRWAVPRTLLGLLPLGIRRMEVPIGSVASIRVGRAVSPLRLFIGMAAIITPWLFLPWWVSLPLVILGLWVVLVALGPHLILVTRSDGTRRTPVCFGHQLDAELYIAAVEDLVAAARSSE